MKSRALAILLASIMVSSTLTGCSSIFSKAAEDLPLVSPLSEKEIVDYYKKSLEFDTVASRNLDVQEVRYETTVASPEKTKEIKALTGQVQSALGGMTYNYNAELAKMISEESFNYIKGYLNDMKLTNGDMKEVKEALGHYFVDIEYDVSPRSIGELLPSSTLLGLHGAFKQDYDGSDSVNTTLLDKSVGNMNRYYSDNKISKSVSFDKSTLSLSMNGNDAPALDVKQPAIEDVRKSSDKAKAPVISKDETVKSERAPKINTREFNRTAGASITQSAYMPNLDKVYKVPEADGIIGGIGIYPAGDCGLRRFGFNRAQGNGKMTLRYVFKTSVDNPLDISGINIYPVYYELASGVSTDKENVTVPDFLMTEFQKVIDRSDRALVSTDLSALMSGELYSDAGVAVLTGYQSQHTNILRNMSTVRRVIARDTVSNAYLLEVETIRQEGAIGTHTCGVYRDKNYVVVEQYGNKFIITDTVTMTRKMTKEPSLNPDSSIEKRISALNLAGPVKEDNKVAIQGLLDNLYMAGTARVLTGPKESKIDGKKLTVENGMYDCFNSDPGLLPKAKKEYMNSTLRDILTKQGLDRDATYTGIVTEWIGGADNQAELLTEELVTYDKKGTGTYMQVYYLVSNIHDTWVIDDMKIIEKEDKSGEELKQLVARINK